MTSAITFKDCGPIPQRKDIPMASRKAKAEVGRTKRVFICSPFRGIGHTEDEAKEEFRENMKLARFATRYATLEGYVPYAPHLYFPRFLCDHDPDERNKGRNLGLTWLAQCDELWIIGRHVSEGMKTEITKAQEWGIPIRHYVPERTPEERLLDAIFYPDIKIREMVMEEAKA